MPNPPLLLMRLEGPMQSWGLRARWDVRDTSDQPSKSGIIGLLGCALGYPMYDPRLEELDGQLQIGVRVEQAGGVLWYYHTISGELPTAEGGTKGRQDDPATIVSRRGYLHDAAFLVVAAGPPGLLECCRDALARPKWPLFLGRKSCPPSRPVLEELTDRYKSIEHALRNHPWSCEWMELLAAPPQPPLRYTLEDEKGGPRRLDALRINPARMYAERRLRIGVLEVIPGRTAGEQR